MKARGATIAKHRYKTVLIGKYVNTTKGQINVRDRYFYKRSMKTAKFLVSSVLPLFNFCN
jgi:hypothetical protein